MSEAASAARRCGTTRSSQPPHPDSRSRQCASSSRAKASTAPSAAAPSPSSESRSVPTAMVASTSLIHTGVAAMTAHNDCPEQFTFPARHLYNMQTFKIGQQVADMDMLANTFMRAPGESVGTFALECAIDELAAQMWHRSHRASASATSRRKIRPPESLSPPAYCRSLPRTEPSASAGISAAQLPAPAARANG